MLRRLHPIQVELPESHDSKALDLNQRDLRALFLQVLLRRSKEMVTGGGLILWVRPCLGEVRVEAAIGSNGVDKEARAVDRFAPSETVHEVGLVEQDVEGVAPHGVQVLNMSVDCKIAGRDGLQ